MPSMTPETMAASEVSRGKDEGIDRQGMIETCCIADWTGQKWCSSIWSITNSAWCTRQFCMYGVTHAHHDWMV